MNASRDRDSDPRPSYSKAALDQNLDSSSEELPMHHDYENPRDLQINIAKDIGAVDGSRKKKNLFYEPSIPLRPLRNGSVMHNDVSDSHQHSFIKDTHHQHSKLYRFLCALAFFLCLAAFSLSALTSLGIIGPKCSCAFTGDAVTTSQRLLSERPTPDVNVSALEALYAEVSYINTIVDSLKGQIKQISVDNRGPEGPRGPQGPPGPRGPKGGDLTGCGYKSTMVEATIQEPAKLAQASTRKISAPDGYVILGVTCTTLGGSEHGLFTEIDGGKVFYQCKCGGKASSAVFSTEYDDKMIKCRIHWWECPI